MHPAVASRRRGEALLEPIYDAALAELVEAGYEGFSMERVASRARAGKASLYRRWRSRLDLVVEALDHRLPSFEQVPDTGSLREDLLVVMRAVAESLRGDAERAAVSCSSVFSALGANPEVSKIIKRRLMDPRKAVLAKIIAQAAARGEIPEGHPGERVVDLGPKLLLAEVLHNGPCLPDAVLQEIVDQILVPLLRSAPGGARP